MTSSGKPFSLEAPPKPRLTFGIELEFLVPWLFEGDEDRLSSIEGIQECFRVPAGIDRRQGQEVVRQAMNLVLQEHGLQTEPIEAGYSSQFEQTVLRNYTRWDVDFDTTVRQGRPDVDDGYGAYKFAGMEVRAAVDIDDPQAFEVVDYVRKLLISRFRIRVNPTCGFHVHVGQGIERFSLDQIRRICSLVWSSEHLLTHLNHPSRIVSNMSKTLRHTSNLADPTYDGQPRHLRLQTERDQVCGRYLTADRLYGEDPTSFREQNVIWRKLDSFYRADYSRIFQEARRENPYKPFQVRQGGSGGSREDSIKVNDHGLSIDDEIDSRIIEYSEKNPASTANTASEDPRAPSRTRTRRIANSWPTDNDLLRNADLLLSYGLEVVKFEDQNRYPDFGVIEGVRKIYNCNSSCEIAQVVGSNHGDMVSLFWYTCGCTTHPDHYHRRTIEFRGAEGTMSGWIKTWAKICVGLVRFAISASVIDFLSVIEKCKRSMEENNFYDVIDLLEDLCLPVEAALAERHIQENAEKWRVNFVAEE